MSHTKVVLAVVVFAAAATWGAANAQQTKKPVSPTKTLAERVTELERKVSELEQTIAALGNPRQPNAAAKAAQGGTWAAFHAECGLQALSNNGVRAEAQFADNWQGKKVDWTGTVVTVTQRGGGYTIVCKMPGTNSLIADVDYEVPATMRATALSLSKGKTVRIQGRLVRQGGAVLNHTVESEE